MTVAEHFRCAAHTTRDVQALLGYLPTPVRPAPGPGSLTRPTTTPSPSPRSAPGSSPSWVTRHRSSPSPARPARTAWASTRGTCPSQSCSAFDRARTELGYRQAISYDDALRQDIDWAVRAVADAEAGGGSWQDVFPSMVARYGLSGWFPYTAEDTYIG